MTKAWANLEPADRNALEELGWSQQTFDDNAGPPDTPWSTLSERQRMLAMMMGCDEEVWTQAVEEDKRYKADLAFAATLPERVAASLVSVDELLGELTADAAAYEEEMNRAAAAEEYAAATKIQAIQRGKSIRKDVAAQHAAATKLQARQRGRVDRKFVVEKKEAARVAEEARRAEAESQRVIRVEAEKQKARDRHYGAQASALGLSSFADIRARAAEQASNFSGGRWHVDAAKETRGQAGKKLGRWEGGTPADGESVADRLGRLKINPNGMKVGAPLLVERQPPKLWAQHRPDKWRESLVTTPVVRGRPPPTPRQRAAPEGATAVAAVEGSAAPTSNPQAAFDSEERKEMEARLQRLTEVCRMFLCIKCYCAHRHNHMHACVLSASVFRLLY